MSPQLTPACRQAGNDNERKLFGRINPRRFVSPCEAKRNSGDKFGRITYVALAGSISYVLTYFSYDTLKNEDNLFR